MSAPWLIIAATFLFASMGVCVKLASLQYSAGEIVLYRSLFTAAYIIGWVRINGGTLRTAIPGAHFWRSLSGVLSLGLWFYALAQLPLATATVLNYMSSVWIAVAMVFAALALQGERVNPRLVAAVLVGFAGVVLVLRPTIEQDQLGHGLAGLVSGVLAAAAYMQVKVLNRLGEPDYRVVFYFAAGGIALGALTLPFTGLHAHTWQGVALLLAIGVLATVGQMMLTRAYAVGRLLTIAALQYCGILFSYVYGILVFDELLSWQATVGIGLIVAAGVAATRLNTPPATKQTEARA